MVQASYYSPAVYMADVVLPSPIWAERKGKYVSLDGGVRELQPVLRPRDGLPQDEEIFKAISQKMEQGLS